MDELAEQPDSLNSRTQLGNETETGLLPPEEVPAYVIGNLSPSDQKFLDTWLSNGMSNALDAMAMTVYGKHSVELTDKERSRCNGRTYQILHGKRDDGSTANRTQMAWSYIAYRRQQAAWEAEVSTKGLVADAALAVFGDRVELSAVLAENGGDLRKVPQRLRGLVEDMEIEVYMDGKGDDAVPVKRIRPHFVSKTAARDQLMKFLGAYKKDNEQQESKTLILSGFGLKDLTPEQKAVLIAELATEQQETRVPVNDCICRE